MRVCQLPTTNGVRSLLRAALVIGLGSVAACGSVANTLPKGDAGSGGTGPGTGGAPAGSGGIGGGGVDAAADSGAQGGAGGSAAGGAGGGPSGVGGSSDGGALDAAVDRTAADVRIDGGPPPASCQAIKQQNPAATSGVYTIAPIGVAQSAFCEMTSGGGGWTAFYVGDNGTTPGDNHFELAVDACPDPANSCLRRLSTAVDETHDFAVKCGASVVKFNLNALAIDYFRNGIEHQWQPLTNASTIDVGFVGKANLVLNLWTGGTVANYGWIVAGTDAPSATPAARATTFANGYTPNTLWNFCNGAAETGAGSRVMLLYR